jgi:hypothetical protein
LPRPISGRAEIDDLFASLKHKKVKRKAGPAADPLPPPPPPTTTSGRGPPVVVADAPPPPRNRKGGGAPLPPPATADEAAVGDKDDLFGTAPAAARR